MKWWQGLILGILADQGLKKAFLVYFPEKVTLNQGISFGWLPSSWWLIINFIFLLLLVLFFKKNWGTVLVLTGGAANLVDRFFRGKVVDFINLPFVFLPAFNLADVFICLGAGLMAFSLFLPTFSLKKD